MAGERHGRGMLCANRRLKATETACLNVVVHHYHGLFFLLWRCDPTRVMTSSFLRFLDHIQRRTTVCRTPLDEWSARRRDPYLTTHNTHNRETSMPPVGFEPTISAGDRPQTYALDRAATGTGTVTVLPAVNSYIVVKHCQNTKNLRTKDDRV